MEEADARRQPASARGLVDERSKAFTNRMKVRSPRSREVRGFKPHLRARQTEPVLAGLRKAEGTGPDGKHIRKFRREMARLVERRP